ncbi:MAG: MFS transporter, partial [Verrucomicrobiota bacterium]
MANRNLRLRYAIFTMSLLIIGRMVNSLPVYRDVLQNYLSIGDDNLGLIFSMTGLGAVSVLIGGAYSDRYGPRKVMRFCFAGIALAFFCFAAAGKNWVLVAAAMGMHGLFNRPLMVAVNTYLIRLFPNNKRRALSFNLAGSNVGAMFIPSMAEGFLGMSRRYAAVSFAAIFHIPFAIAGLFLLSGSYLYKKKASLGGVQKTEGKRFKLCDMGIPPRFVPIVVFMVLHGMGDTALVFWLPRYLTSGVFESVLIAPGYLITGHAVVYLLARTVVGLIPERYGRKWLLVCPGLVGGSVFIIGILSGNYLVTAVSYLLASFTWSAEFPAMLALIGN